MKHLVLIPALVIGSTLMTSMTTVTPDIKTEKVNPEEGVEQPTFKGGFDALVKFMGENIQYPKSVQNREATVFVSFMVQENGSISDAKVLKSSGETAFDKEAIRVINLMPNWIPGIKNGKVSAMEMKLPIKFTDK